MSAPPSGHELVGEYGVSVRLLHGEDLDAVHDLAFLSVLEIAVLPNPAVAAARETFTGRADHDLSGPTAVEPPQLMGKKTDDGNVAGEDGVLAHELRWLNGSGTAEIVVGASREGLPGGSDCWVRDNSYLQHGEKGDVMDSIEVFTVEETYGNTVFTDELMTGRWG